MYKRHYILLMAFASACAAAVPIAWKPLSMPEVPRAFYRVAAPEGALLGCGSDGIFGAEGTGSGWKMLYDSASCEYMLQVGDAVYAAQADRIARSDDAGKTWKPESGTMPGEPIASIQEAGGKLFAIGWSGAVYSSLVGSAVWKRGTLPDPSYPVSFAIAAAGKNLYAMFQESRVYRSADGGGTWSRLNPGVTDQAFYGMAGFGDTLLIAYASGMLRCTRNGTHWEKIPEFADRNTITGIFRTGGSIYAQNSDSLFRSRDGGRTWTATADLPTVGTLSIGSDGTFLGLGPESEVYRSADSGKSWSVTRPPTRRSGIGLPLPAGKTLYAVDRFDGCFRSVDSGSTWSRCADMPGIREIAGEGSHIYALRIDGALFKASVNGSNWSKVAEGRPKIASTRSLIVSGGDAFAAFPDSGIMRAQAGSWRPAAPLVQAPVSRLAGGGRFMYAVGAGLPFFSADGGISWGAPPESVRELDPRGFAPLGDGWCAFGDSGILRTLDGGKTWAPLPPPWPSGKPIRAPAGLPHGPFCGGSDDGSVYCTSDSGRTWKAYSGLPLIAIAGLGFWGGTLLTWNTDGTLMRGVLPEETVDIARGVSRPRLLLRRPIPEGRRIDGRVPQRAVPE